MSAPAKTEVESMKVHCDGGDGASGHPRVYLNLGNDNKVECPYCGHEFVLKPGAKVSDAH
ncbi:MAG: zinc-finger domain-containing protein [Sneathiella sp.]